MIKILNLSDRQQFLDMMYEIDTVMGQPMDTVSSLTGRSRRQILSDYLIDSWLQYPNSVTRRNIGWFHNDELKAVLFQDFYRVIEASKYKAFDRYAISKLRHRYELVLDETVPAHEKPMTSLSWNWLFEGSAKGIDTVIVKGLLKQEFRPNTI